MLNQVKFWVFMVATSLLLTILVVAIYKHKKHRTIPPTQSVVQQIMVSPSNAWVGTFTRDSNPWTKNGDGSIEVTCGGKQINVAIVGWPNSTPPTKIQFAQNTTCKYLRDMLNKKVVIVGSAQNNGIVAESLIEVDVSDSK